MSRRLVASGARVTVVTPDRSVHAEKRPTCFVRRVGCDVRDADAMRRSFVNRTCCFTCRRAPRVQREILTDLDERPRQPRAHEASPRTLGSCVRRFAARMAVRPEPVREDHPPIRCARTPFTS
jgi:hypothetical protein